MTNIDDLPLQNFQKLDDTHEKLLDSISPMGGKNVSFYPLVCAFFISILVYILTTDYFHNFFKNVPYLPFVKAGIIFSSVLLMLLMCF